MKPLKMICCGLVGLFLVCGTLAAWEMDGRMKEWDITPLRPYDIVTLPDGSTWINQYESSVETGRIMKIDYLTGKRSAYALMDPAQFQTLDADKDGNLWIADALDTIVRFDTGTTMWTVYPLDPAVFTLPARPFGVTVANDGSVWFTCWEDRCLGRFDPATETFERFAPMPMNELPSEPVEIAFDGAGNPWFTMLGANPGFGKYEISTGMFGIMTDPAFHAPFGIIYDSGKIWFLDHSANLLVSYHPVQMEMSKRLIPPELTDAHFLVADRDHKLWVTAFATSAIGVYDPATGDWQHRYLEDPGARPMGIDTHRSGRICWAESFSPEHGGVGFFFVDAETALFSPRTTMTYGHHCVNDCDLGTLHVGEEVEFYKKWKGFPCLNAADWYVHPTDSLYRLHASLREDRLLWSPKGGSVYVKKNDIFRRKGLSLEVVFRGSEFNVPGIDGIAVMDNGNILFSPDGPVTHFQYPYPPVFIDDEDIAIYYPTANKIGVFLRGKDYGITSMDAIELYAATLFFSVRDPVYITHGPVPFYLEDGDIGGIDLFTDEVELKSKGAAMNIYDMDALSLLPFELKFVYGSGIGL